MSARLVANHPTHHQSAQTSPHHHHHRDDKPRHRTRPSAAAAQAGAMSLEEALRIVALSGAAGAAAMTQAQQAAAAQPSTATTPRARPAGHARRTTGEPARTGHHRTQSGHKHHKKHSSRQSSTHHDDDDRSLHALTETALHRHTQQYVSQRSTSSNATVSPHTHAVNSRSPTFEPVLPPPLQLTRYESYRSVNEETKTNDVYIGAAAAHGNGSDSCESGKRTDWSHATRQHQQQQQQHRSMHKSPVLSTSTSSSSLVSLVQQQQPQPSSEHRQQQPIMTPRIISAPTPVSQTNKSNSKNTNTIVQTFAQSLTIVSPNSQMPKSFSTTHLPLPKTSHFRYAYHADTVDSDDEQDDESCDLSPISAKMQAQTPTRFTYM